MHTAEYYTTLKGIRWISIYYTKKMPFIVVELWKNKLQELCIIWSYFLFLKMEVNVSINIGEIDKSAYSWELKGER